MVSVEPGGSGGGLVERARSRRVRRPTIRHGLTVAAIAAVLAVAPGVAEGVRGPAGTLLEALAPSAGGHAAVPAGGHEASVDNHAAAASAFSMQGGHGAVQAPAGTLPASNPDPSTAVAFGASSIPYLPHTSSTADQYVGKTSSAALPLTSITIRLLSASGTSGIVDGAGFGPSGGTVDAIIDQPDLSPPILPADGFLGDPVGNVVVDLSGLFTTQFDGSLFASGNCNMAAGAMLYEVQTGLNVTGGQMRAWSGATTRGTSLEDLSHAFATQGQPLFIQRYMPWHVFQREVASGRSAVVQGWYGNLPNRYDMQPDFVAGHSVFVLGYSSHVFGGRGGFYVMDPLGRSGYNGQWWPSDVLRTYGWSGQPGHAGDGTHLAYLGFVALQSNRSAKRLDGSGRPAFQDYWQTTKAALEAALKVIVTDGHGSNLPAIRGVVLLIRDARLSLTAVTAQNLRALSWPVAGIPKVVHRFSDRHPGLELARGRHSQALAAADGRVIFESLPSASGTTTIWVEHGPDLITAYSGLGHVNVKPGQWVSQGEILGTLPKSGNLIFSVSQGALPTSSSGHADPTRFLPLT
jgi:hypothetical protein